LLVLAGYCLTPGLYAAPEPGGTQVNEDLPRAKKWNRFADAIYELHQHRISKRRIYTEEEMGGYGGMTNDLNFFKEVKYFDTSSKRLLSTIKWENKNPDNIHVIELYIYDESGRVVREYTAAYLPVHRKAPFQTLINLHHYEDGLHGYRQFDASGDRLYEQCRGELSDKDIFISYEDYEIPDRVTSIQDKNLREAYRACFGDIPRSASPYTDPLKEISMVN